MRTEDEAWEAWNTRPIEDALTAEVERLTGLIKHAEWRSVVDTFEGESGCPWCSAAESDGHAADCHAFPPPANEV